MTHLVLFIAFLSHRICCDLSIINIPWGEGWSARWKGLWGTGQKKQEVMAEVEGKTEGQEDGDEEKKLSVEVRF